MFQKNYRTIFFFFSRRRRRRRILNFSFFFFCKIYEQTEAPNSGRPKKIVFFYLLMALGVKINQTNIVWMHIMWYAKRIHMNILQENRSCNYFVVI